MTRIFPRENLSLWLRRLADEKRVIAPTEVAGETVFRQISQVEEITFDFDNTTLSPKEWFFPATETLFWVEGKDEGAELIPKKVEKGTVIFGLRPCDAKGISLLDRPFLDEPSDTLYREHRDKTTLVGISCTRAGPECFCESMGSTPNDLSFLDILLTGVKEGYIVQTVTDKGKALLPKDLLQELEVTPPLPPSTSAVHVEKIEGKMGKLFDNPFWDRLADRCLHCNICAYVCPVCHCFDVRDYPSGDGKVERVRSWDSCQSPGFSRQAGWIEPRPTKGARLKQRFYHKFLYFPERYGELACVGCGRCVKSCPVNIDIREVIDNVQRIGV